jgi:hypothetical protein
MPRLIALLAFVAILAPSLRAAETAPRAAWMREAGWGVMTHYLYEWIVGREGRATMSPEGWNELVDGFNVEALADQLKSAGAGWYQISIGQNSGYYLSPNATYDRLTDIAPSRLSRRDLVADLAAALGKRGIKLLVYLPSGAPAGDRAARDALKWQNGPGPYPNREFQKNWEAVIREWSMRWGDKVAGWWFDGVYWPNIMYRSDEPPNFGSFAAAARAGNPRSAVAFNPGVIYRTISLTPHEDFIAGEVNDLARWDPKRGTDGLVDGAQIQVLTYLGETWGRGTPRFKDADVVAFAEKVRAVGGVITWDTPTQRDGTFAPQFFAQLKAIGEAMAAISKP